MGKQCLSNPVSALTIPNGTAWQSEISTAMAPRIFLLALIPKPTASGSIREMGYSRQSSRRMMCGRNMAKHLDPLIHAYAILLRLYPTSFQAEFADEMLVVFAATVTEAAGWQILARVCWREWRDAPVAIIRAH